MNAYLDVKDGVEAKYKPNYETIESVAPKLTISPEKKTFGKEVFKIPPGTRAFIDGRYTFS